MKCFSLSHLEDHDVRKGLLAAVPAERTATAAVLAHVAEFDARQLYRDQSCSSMFVYCVRELGYSEDGAQRRIRVARTARRFPILFDALADGRLHMTGVSLLEPHLTDENAAELVAAASHLSKADLVRELAVRFPKDEAVVLQNSRVSQGISPALARVEGPDGGTGADESVAGDLTALLPDVAPAPPPLRRDRITPISADTCALEATLDQESYDLLRQIQALQGRGVPAHGIAGVIKRGLKLLAADLLERKLGAGTGQPRGSKDPYYISPAVKRAVWKRDGGRCTFRGDNGKCCGETHDVEFDHIDPPSRGGDGSERNVRLRCKAHNQREAEKLYGERFMREKREAAKRQQAEASAQREQRAAERAQREADRARARQQREAERAACVAEREKQSAASEAARAAAAAERAEQRATAEQARQAAAAARARIDELVSPLRSLGCSLEQALRAAARAEGMPDAPIEARLRVAIQSLAPPGTRKVAADGSSLTYS